MNNNDQGTLVNLAGFIREKKAQRDHAVGEMRLALGRGAKRVLASLGGSANAFTVADVMGTDVLTAGELHQNRETTVEWGLTARDERGLPFAVAISEDYHEEPAIWKLVDLCTQEELEFAMGKMSSAWSTRSAELEAIQGRCRERFGKAPELNLPHPNTLDTSPRQAQ